MGLYVAIVSNTDTLEVRFTKAFHIRDCIQGFIKKYQADRISLSHAFSLVEVEGVESAEEGQPGQVELIFAGIGPEIHFINTQGV